MSEQVRQATRELRWEQIQTAIAELLREGNQPITVVEVARRCDIPRSAISKENSWKAAITAAEAVRLKQRAEHLHQQQLGFKVTPLPEREAPVVPPVAERRRVTVETVISDLQGLLAQATQNAHDAYQRGREDAIRDLESTRDVEAAQQEAFERGREAGRTEAAADLNAAYLRGREEGHREFAEDLNQAYQRGLTDGRAEAPAGKGTYEQGRREGRAEALAEQQGAFERGRQLGRAELQVEAKKAYDEGLKEGKAQAAADVMSAYDRGRRDGWEEGRREGTAPPRSGMFGFSVSRSNPDKEWALALLHASATTSPDQLRATYRMLTKAYHPDRNPDIPPEFIRNLNRAKEILGF